MSAIRDHYEDAFLEAENELSEPEKTRSKGCCQCCQTRRNRIHAEVLSLINEQALREQQDESGDLSPADSSLEISDPPKPDDLKGTLSKRKHKKSVCSLKDHRKKAGIPEPKFNRQSTGSWSILNRKPPGQRSTSSIVSSSFIEPEYSLNCGIHDFTRHIVYCIVRKTHPRTIINPAWNSDSSSQSFSSARESMQGSSISGSHNSVFSAISTINITWFPVLKPSPGPSTPRRSTVTSAKIQTEMPLFSVEYKTPLSRLYDRTLGNLDADSKTVRATVLSWPMYLQARKTKAQGFEKWMVVFYTSSSADDKQAFYCTLSRALLQHYRVAYIERDIAVAKTNYGPELRQRLKKPKEEQLTVPEIFISGENFGSGNVLYAAHHLNKMYGIFKRYILPPSIYTEWLATKALPEKDKTLPFVVALKEFPALRWMARGAKIRVAHKDLNTIEAGKDIVKRAKSEWVYYSQRIAPKVDYLRFVLLRCTVALCFKVLDDIYWKSLFPDAEFRKIDDTFTRNAVDTRRPSVAWNIPSKKTVNHDRRLSTGFLRKPMSRLGSSISSTSSES